MTSGPGSRNGQQQDRGLADPRKYLRLAAVLRQRISDASLRPGQALPSITTLSAEHHLARGTVRRTMKTLLGEGLVYRVPGLGYFATPADISPEGDDESRPSSTA